ncbi:MAG: hypothetical protein ACI8Z9_000400 [Paraglaciecola sp.]|jgi:hypothetical protein
MNINDRLLLACFFCLALIAFHAPAALIDDLYDAKIEVLDQSQANYKKALRRALQQVLIKVSGNRALLDSAQITRNLSQAADYLRAYRYETLDGRLYLLINFSPQRIEKMIRIAGFPVWDKRRPDSIIWLAMEEPQSGQRRIMSRETDMPLFAALDVSASLRGIEIIEPLWDLNDREQLGLYDIWGGFTQHINQASQRYDVQAVLSARLFQGNVANNEVSRTWQADWTLSHNGQLLSGKIAGPEQELLISDLVNILADKLAAEYAIDLTDQDPNEAKTEISIMNVASLGSYVQVLRFLNSLSVVANAALIVQQGEKATFGLNLLGNEQDLVRALSLDNKIKPLVDEFGQPSQQLAYIWSLDE